MFVVVAQRFQHSTDLARTWDSPKEAEEPGHRRPTELPARHCPVRRRVRPHSRRPGRDQSGCRFGFGFAFEPRE